MFQSIVCASDFSKTASRAVEIATAWAERQKSALEIVHVLEPPLATYPGDATWLTADLLAMLEQDLVTRMEGELAKVQQHVPGANGRVVRGTPHWEILRRVEQTHADLIVLGTDGAGAIARAFLGSVADRVLRSSTTPVLLVPGEGRQASPVPRVIVAPTDLSPAAKAAVARTLEHARAIGSKLVLVHAHEIPAAVARDKALAAAIGPALVAELREAHGLGDAADVEIVVREGAAPAVIVDVCEERKADLIAIASTGRGLVSSLLLGGVTDRVVRTSHVPVLVLRNKR